MVDEIPEFHPFCRFTPMCEKLILFLSKLLKEKRMKRIALVLGLVFLVALAASANVFDFTLANKTGYDIDEIFVSPADADDWGDDVLEEDILPNGKSFEIEFDSDYEAILLAFDIDKYDLMVTYEDGSTDEWYDLKLETINQITLTLDKKGNGVATVK
jgi:hypothetical protein